MSDTPTTNGIREGSLEAPSRHPMRWKEPSFLDEAALGAELDRVFEICHGCRRCFNLCNAFPTLFDAIDATDSGELGAVPKHVRWQVVDQCYLCDLCYMTKCPYVPPHPWNLDFPHLMLRAKAVGHARGRTRFADRVLASTDAVGTIAGIPVIAELVNAANGTRAGRGLLRKALGVHEDAPLPKYHADSFRSRERRRRKPRLEAVPTEHTRGQVALFATCYCNRNEPGIAADLVAVFEHNGIPVRLAAKERCCGMPRLELGDLAAVERAKDANVPQLAALVDEGYDVVAPVPSCVLTFKQELPLLFPDDELVRKVQRRTYDPFEYLWLRHRAGLLRTDFVQELGHVAYHVPCHLRVQNVGLKTRDVLKLVPNTTLDVIERCSGHDGTYGVKARFHETSMKIGRPVFAKVRNSPATHHSSDCPMAGHQIANGLDDRRPPVHPLTLLRTAYGLPAPR